jgi:hypothetical protein
MPFADITFDVLAVLFTIAVSTVLTRRWGQLAKARRQARKARRGARVRVGKPSRRRHWLSALWPKLQAGPLTFARRRTVSTVAKPEPGTNWERLKAIIESPFPRIQVAIEAQSSASIQIDAAEHGFNRLVDDVGMVMTPAVAPTVRAARSLPPNDAPTTQPRAAA